MWLILSGFFLVVAICTKDSSFFITSAIFAVAHNIEYLAIQVKDLKR